MARNASVRLPVSGEGLALDGSEHRPLLWRRSFSEGLIALLRARLWSVQACVGHDEHGEYGVHDLWCCTPYLLGSSTGALTTEPRHSVDVQNRGAFSAGEINAWPLSSHCARRVYRLCFGCLPSMALSQAGKTRRGMDARYRELCHDLSLGVFLL